MTQELQEALDALSSIDPSLRAACAGALRKVGNACRDLDRVRGDGLLDAANVLERRRA